MAVGIVSAVKEGESLRLEVCSSYVRGCGCGADAAHALYEFVKAPMDERPFDEWADECARSALQLAGMTRREREAEPVARLAGMTLPE